MEKEGKFSRRRCRTLRASARTWRTEVQYDIRIREERAKWGLEKDHLSTQKQEVQEQVDRLQRKTEDMLEKTRSLGDRGMMRK